MWICAGNHGIYKEKSQHFKSEITNSGRDGLKDDEVTSSEEVTQEKRGLTEGNNYRHVDIILPQCCVLADLQSNSSLRLELPLLNDVESRTPSLIPPDVPCMSAFAENIYESAAKLLYIAIKWAKTIPSFLQVSICSR